MTEPAGAEPLRSFGSRWIHGVAAGGTPIPAARTGFPSVGLDAARGGPAA